MTREEAKSCIGTIEMLQRLAYNIHGVMDAIDADNCKKIIKALEQEPTTKNDLVVDWENYKDVDGNSLDDLILEVLQNNFDCGNTYGYKVADEIIELLPSVTPQEPREITLEDVKGYCKPRCLSIISNELLYELTHPKIKALEQEPRKGHWIE